jgi:hypothetical protein
MGRQELRQVLALDRDGVRGFPDEEGQKPDGLHNPEELVIGPQVPKIEHPLIEVLALARLELPGDRVEEVVGPTRITGGRHRPFPSGACVSLHASLREPGSRRPRRGCPAVIAWRHT